MRGHERTDDSYPTSTPGWTPFTCQASLCEGAAGVTLVVNGESLGPTLHTKGLGAICFAYGLDNRSELFHAGNSPPMGLRWLIWHFCWLLSHRQDDPDIEEFVTGGLDDAAALMPEERFADIRARFDARLALVHRTSTEHRP